MEQQKKQLKIIQSEINELLEEILTIGLNHEVNIITDKKTGKIICWDFENEKVSYINETYTKMPIVEALIFLEFLYKNAKTPKGDEDKLIIGAEITAYRHCLRMTQRMFAENLLIPLRTLEDWESGRKMPSAFTYKKIRDYFLQNFKFGQQLFGKESPDYLD